MAGLLVVFFPLFLLGFLLFMERVEEPLRRAVAGTDDVEEFLDKAGSKDMYNLWRFGVRRSLERWRNRRRRGQPTQPAALAMRNGDDEQPAVVEEHGAKPGPEYA